MSDSQEQPDTNNSNAPKIPNHLYYEEKTYFAGIIVGSILYGTLKASQSAHPLSFCAQFVRLILGVLIVVFFQCIVALFNPVNRRRDGLKWGLVSYNLSPLHTNKEGRCPQPDVIKNSPGSRSLKAPLNRGPELPERAGPGAKPLPEVRARKVAENVNTRNKAHE